MKKCVTILCALFLVLPMAACGSSFDPSVTSLYVQKNGELTYAVVESFEKEYYSLSEFQSMIDREVESCNSNYSEPAISVERLEVENGTLYLLLNFSNAKAYSSYNEEYCFVGTIEEALGVGQSFDLLFKDADYEECTTAEVTEKKDNQVLILQNEGIVQLEKPVKYVSNNVEIISDHMVEVMPIEEEDEYAYIITY